MLERQRQALNPRPAWIDPEIGLPYPDKLHLPKLKYTLNLLISCNGGVSSLSSSSNLARYLNLFNGVEDDTATDLLSPYLDMIRGMNYLKSEKLFVFR